MSREEMFDFIGRHVIETEIAGLAFGGLAMYVWSLFDRHRTSAQDSQTSV